MKFVVSTSTLLKQLQAVNGASSSSTVLPILDNFLFELRNGTLIISATDLQTSMTTSLPVESEENGKIAIPSKILIDTLKTLPDQPISFIIDNNTFAIEIKADNGRYKLSGENGEDFPKIPVVEDGSAVEIPASVLAEAINKTLFAVSNDELRPAMTGVYCQLSPEHITFVSTDAHKLARYRRKDTHSESVASFIIPKKALVLLKSSLPNEDVTVSVKYNHTSAFFNFGNIHLICRLIDERYPDYEAIIPRNNPNKLTIDRSLLLNCLKRVVIFANKATNQVRLSVEGNQLHISSEDLDFSNEAQERLNCQYEGQPIEIGFNAKFLIEMLSNLSGEEVFFELSTPNRAGLLIPQNHDPEEEVLMLVMPVMLNTHAPLSKV